MTQTTTAKALPPNDLNR